MLGCIGIGHLAAAVNTPTISIFGPTDPLLWKPYGKKSIVVIKPEINCPGGYDHAVTCKIQKCLVGIKPKEVIDGILYCITKYVNHEKLFSINNFKITEHLTIKKTSKGYVLQNNATEHACLVKDGWLNVKYVLNEINKNNCTKTVIENLPHQKPLIDMLIMHRILEPCPLIGLN